MNDAEILQAALLALTAQNVTGGGTAALWITGLQTEIILYGLVSEWEEITGRF